MQAQGLRKKHCSRNMAMARNFAGSGAWFCYIFNMIKKMCVCSCLCFMLFADQFSGGHVRAGAQDPSVALGGHVHAGAPTLH